ncbi:LysR family transcriptional regulator [Arthrobacter oryzae]|uniref:LysR substrate-binding domain-containing protein n=1 Tax=Arthrobacter oryzae TaxID=409290 RepID=UPI00273C448A|nr:LysR family transcriptional regulator [Arthrobacter oryzae]WLQ05706.1 LysR family transcriptional regulator [Arthrobacter oryzae]
MEKITLRQIDAALAVEMAGSICLAAKQMHVAQPSLSQQIVALEDEVGVRLFDRLPSGTFPTAAGQAFLDKVRHLSGEIATARLASLTAAAAEIPEIAVGIQHSEHVARVAAALGSLRGQHPQLRARVQEYENGQLLREAIQRGTIDVGFGVDFKEWPGDLMLAFDVDYMLLVPVHHRLAGRDQVSAEDLLGEGWVGSPALQRLASISDGWRFADDVTLAASSAQAAEAMVAAGLGITFTTADRAVDERSLQKIVLNPPPTERVMAAARTDIGPLERALVNAVAAQTQPAAVAAA